MFTLYTNCYKKTQEISQLKKKYNDLLNEYSNKCDEANNGNKSIYKQQ